MSGSLEMTKFCTVCSSYVPEPCTDPDCPMSDDVDECDKARRAEDYVESLDFEHLADSDYEEPRFYPEDFEYEDSDMEDR